CAIAPSVTGKLEPGWKRSTPPTCSFPLFRRKAMERCSGRSPTATLMEACHRSAAYPRCSAGKSCSICEPWNRNKKRHPFCGWRSQKRNELIGCRSGHLRRVLPFDPHTIERPVDKYQRDNEEHQRQQVADRVSLLARQAHRQFDCKQSEQSGELDHRVHGNR